MGEHRDERELRVAVATVGCRANQADSASFARYLDKRRVRLTTSFKDVDIAVINTCCVTAEAERDCRKLARRALRESPSAKVALVGCAVTADIGFGRDIDDRVELVGGRDAEPKNLADWIHGMAGVAKEDLLPKQAALPLGERTRPLLKIQTGCNRGCAYCIVPRARGRERSMAEEDVLKELDLLSKAGIGEVVITGVQLGAWGKDLPGRPSLAHLISRAAERFAPGRIRLSSIEPWSVDDELMAVVGKKDRICPHLHIPLQSGDDGLLLAMKRGYTVFEFLDIAKRVRKAVPKAAIGTDVILGFPGETDRAFESTLETLKSLSPAYVHAFSYSPRPGTAASGLGRGPRREVVKERVRIVREMGDAFSRSFRRAHIGQKREIIVESRLRGEWRGLTDTFQKVVFREGGLEPGQLVKRELEALDENVDLAALPCSLEGTDPNAAYPRG